MDVGDRPAVVLAAGEGRRLAPLTDTRPKPMLPVANRPLLEYVLDAIAEAGIDEIYLVVGYRQERIRNHVGDGDDWGVDVHYIEQTPQLGTGHAILQAADHVDEPFLVFNGDRIVDAELARDVANAHEPGEASVATTVVRHPSTFGVVDIDGDRLTGIEEKPLDPSPRATINAGVYGFDPSIFDRIRQTDHVDGEQTITATLAAMAEEGLVRAVRYDGRWLDVTHLWDLSPVTAQLLSDGEGPAAASSWVADSASVARDVVVGADAYVGANATIGGGTAIGSGATVEANAVLERAVVLPDATVSAGAVVRDGVVGANATIGANATADGGKTTVVVKNEVHDGVTLGGIVGDNAVVGAGATLDAGTVIGTAADVGVGTAVSGWVDQGTEVRRG